MSLKLKAFLLSMLIVGVSAPGWVQAQDDEDEDREEVEVKVRDPRERSSQFDEPVPEERPVRRTSQPAATPSPQARTQEEDPNRDMLFYFPTGKTLPRDELAIGFPGQGIPDIQYGLASWLQLGTGYGVVGFTPNIRLGLLRGKRVDATVVYGAFLPVASPRPFTGQYAGGSVTAGNDEFHVHLGYYWTQFFGDPFPEPPKTREGGLGYTGMDLKLGEHFKVLFMVLTWTEFEQELNGPAPAEEDPVRIFAAAPGIRYWRGRLSLDAGAAAIFVSGDGVGDVPPVLPMFTLRYRL
jgi:hypothetical protein